MRISGLYKKLTVAGALLVCPGAALAADAHATEGGGQAVGFPQLDIATYPTQLFWLAVAFIVLYTLMARVALPKVGDILETRQQRRNNDLGRAETLQAESEEIRLTYEKALAKAHEEANTLLSQTEAEFSALAAQRQAEFATKARERLAQVDQKITKAKTDALESIVDITTDIAADAVAKIVGAKVSKTVAQKAVEQALKDGGR